MIHSFVKKNGLRHSVAAGLAMATLVFAHSASAAPLNLTDGDRISLSYTNTYGGGSGGGEFRASGVGALSGFDSFLTFCLEYPEHIGLNTPYYVDINTVALAGGNGVAATYTSADVGGKAGDVAGTTTGAPTFKSVSDPLSSATAWLYTQFRAGTLAGFDFNTPNNGDANSLQAAIWYFENEQDQAFLNATTKGNQFKTAALAAIASGSWSGIGNVRVLNLWDTRTIDTAGNYTFSGNHQDQLYLIPVPEPETYAMLLAGLGLLGLAGRRRQKKSA